MWVCVYAEVGYEKKFEWGKIGMISPWAGGWRQEAGDIYSLLSSLSFFSMSLSENIEEKIWDGK